MLVHAFVSVLQIRLLQLTIVWSTKGITKETTARSKCCSQGVARTRECDHITPVLWLLIEERIIFKILLLTFKPLNGLAPPYLCHLITKYVPRCKSRSNNGHP